MQNQIGIDGRALDVWSCSGRVDHITLRSNTEVWSQGGGGYVSPQYGGYVSAPEFRSRTSEYKEVRISSDDGAVRTIDAAGCVTCVPGDRIAFVYARDPAVAKGPLVGVINYTERRWWSFNANALIKEPSHLVYRRKRIIAILGAMLVSILAGQLLVALLCLPVLLAMFKAVAKLFDAKVNKALQEEVARRCAAGDDATVRESPASRLTQ
jgi:hypothetical protein